MIAQKKLESIEASRGVAACLVVIYHAARAIAQRGAGLPPLLGVERFGHAGVDFFFVLSGFIIFYVHHADIGKPIKLASYVKRRATRIYPLYWAVLLATIGITSINHSIPAALTIVANAALVPLSSEPIVGVSWTLQHEMLFYVVFAVSICSRSVGVFLFGFWLLSILVADALGQLWGHGGWPKELSPFNVEFFFGMGAASIAQRITPAPKVLLFAGATSFIFSGWLEAAGILDGYGSPARYVYGASAAILVLGLAGVEQRRRVALPSLVRELGKASYSIYLTHVLSIGLALKGMAAIGLSMPSWLLVFILICFGMFAGIVLSRVVEYPLMEIARTLLHRRGGSLTASSPIPEEPRPASPIRGTQE